MAVNLTGGLASLNAEGCGLFLIQTMNDIIKNKLKVKYLILHLIKNKRRWIPIFILWAAFGLFSILNIYEFRIYSSSMRGFQKPLLFSASIRILSYWIVWAAFVPLISWLAGRFPLEKPQRLKRLSINLAAGLIISYSMNPIYQVIKEILPVIFKGFNMGGFSLDISRLTIYPIPIALDNFIIYVFIFLVILSFDYFNRFTTQQIKTSRLEAQLVRAQLDALKMQMQPHFIFNTLNSIAGIIEEDPRAAQEMVCCLGDLLRISLDSSESQEVTLEKEMKFVSCYLDIEKMRYGDRLQIRIRADEEVLKANVPPLILQPIVENAVRHGISAKLSEGRIDVTAEKRESDLVLQVRDNGPGIGNDQKELFQKGMGLANIQKRLKYLYGDKFGFQLLNGEKEGLTVTVKIPFHIKALESFETAAG